MWQNIVLLFQDLTTIQLHSSLKRHIANSSSTMTLCVRTNLIVSITAPKYWPSHQIDQKWKKCDDGIDHNGDADLDDFFFDPEYADSFFVADYVDGPHNHSLAYMASTLEAKIMSTKSLKQLIKCEDCISVLIENELIEDSFIRFKARRTNMLQPCKSTFDICKFVDSFVDTCTGVTSYKHVTMQILQNIPFESLYTSSSFSGHPGEIGHKYMFVKKIVEMYMDMKSTHVAKCFTLKTHDEPIRKINSTKRTINKPNYTILTYINIAQNKRIKKVVCFP